MVLKNVLNKWNKQYQLFKKKKEVKTDTGSRYDWYLDGKSAVGRP